MTLRNRIALYGAYFFGMAGIGFTLPYLPLYLVQRGLSERAVGLVSTLAAVAGLVQFPVGLLSDRLGRRKPFLVAALVLAWIATLALRRAHGPLALALVVALFAENGLCRSVVESLSGSEAAVLSEPGHLGSALGALRFWKPIGVVLMALGGGAVAERWGLDAILIAVAAFQFVAVVLALGIREPHVLTHGGDAPASRWWRDRTLWLFVATMVLFHVANAPGGVYLGLFLKGSLGAPDHVLSLAFVVSNVTWMLVVWPAGRVSDRIGRRPLLLAGWAAAASRLALVALSRTSTEVLSIQILDGLAQGLFAVAAAAWVTDWLGEPQRAATAQVIVGSSLVAGSALGPALAGCLIDVLGYRGMFAVLASVGGLATLIVAATVPGRTGVRGPRTWGTSRSH